MSKQSAKSLLMADLLAKTSSKKLNLDRGDVVEGRVISISDEEVILDLGIKSEGIINKRDLTADKLSSLQVGDQLKAYVYLPENQFGQVILTLFEQSLRGNWQSQNRGQIWQKFIRALEQKGHLNGRVTEINKGGLVVEVDGVRGFLPVSQMGLTAVTEEGLSGMIGKAIVVGVLEVDPSENRLIFSSRKQLSEKDWEKLKSLQVGEEVTLEIQAVTATGLLGNIGVEAFVPIYEVSWDQIEDLSSLYKAGDKVKAKLIGIDETLGRANLSIKQLKEDPWGKQAANYQVDDVVKGTVTEVGQSGIKVDLSTVEGFVPAENIEPGTKFEVGQTTNFLISGLDKRKRVVLLAPFLTTTSGLIYK